MCLGIVPRSGTESLNFLFHISKYLVSETKLANRAIFKNAGGNVYELLVDDTS